MVNKIECVLCGSLVAFCRPQKVKYVPFNSVSGKAGDGRTAFYYISSYKIITFYSRRIHLNSPKIHAFLAKNRKK